MVVGEVATRCDVLVIGGGPGGYAAALRAAHYGAEVVLVERDRVGGTCLNVGCIPSKVLIHAADLAHQAMASTGTGVRLSATIDVPELKTHLGSVVEGLTSGVSGLLASAGVTVLQGTARFSKPNRVAVVGDGPDAGIQHVEFGEAIVATGSRPIEISSLPFSHPKVLDSTGALFAFESVPSRLVVVGGGYIGVELGTAWRKLGAEVTIVEQAGSVLPGLDARLGRVVGRRLGELGVEVLTGATALGFDADDHLRVAVGEAERSVEADAVVVCVGRRPNSDDLGLDIVGVTTDAAGLIPVDASRRAAKRILAIGDITAGPALAHKATAEAEVAAQTATGREAHFDAMAIPAVVFSDPEVATVGLTVAEAKDAGITASRFVFPLGASSRARTLGSAAGHVELVVDEEGTVIGGHLAGPNVTELIGEVTLAIEMAATAEEVAATIHPHPTMSEGLLEAAHRVLGMPLHVRGT